MRLFLLILLGTTLFAPSSLGGSVETVDGRRLEGTIRFVNDQLFIKGEDGVETKLALGAVRKATLMVPPEEAAPKGRVVTPKPVEEAARPAEAAQPQFWQ